MKNLYAIENGNGYVGCPANGGYGLIVADVAPSHDFPLVAENVEFERVGLIDPDMDLDVVEITSGGDGRYVGRRAYLG